VDAEGALGRAGPRIGHAGLQRLGDQAYAALR
jgi:hypothetical protein